jgi:hypothetical protein
MTRRRNQQHRASALPRRPPEGTRPPRTPFSFHQPTHPDAQQQVVAGFEYGPLFGRARSSGALLQVGGSARPNHGFVQKLHSGVAHDFQLLTTLWRDLHVVFLVRILISWSIHGRTQRTPVVSTMRLEYPQAEGINPFARSLS